MSDLRKEIEKRRTFAIISHPDAGKTTLTEKFLLYGGAINLAGSVKGKATARHAVSDWMEIEKQRGISVTSSVLQFNYDGYCINILDTPGHQDFSEDTYRTLMAADSAVMVIDASKGVEAIGLVIPELNGKLIGSAQRVPTPTGSTTILTAVVKKAGVTKEDINAAMKAAANESFGYNEDEIVSSDIVGMRFGSLFDATQTMVNPIGDDLYEVQVVSWYDNENSYTSQMVRTIKYFSELA